MKVLLIRHGEPRYDEIRARGYHGFRYDFGRLTAEGVLQAKKAAEDPILKGATIIISSPYTRSLQTAAIISRITQIELTVENDVHEWMPEIDYANKNTKNSYDEYILNRGQETTNKSTNWETVEALRKRVINAITPYKKEHEKIIVVCHGMVMSAMTNFDDLIEYCEIREIEI
ncbi:MAG: histidine phosphatase family protein [Acholeplasmataceae bacterium]|jgi:broad specificity phosphatase PhoE|nr:histidine phosphatase family protein [Acholeplasmataceae bacterium]